MRAWMASSVARWLASLGCAGLVSWGVARSHLTDSASGRTGLAALVALAYLGFCGITWARHQGAQRRQERQWAADALPAAAAAAGDSPATLVVFASQTGFAEQLALQTAHSLRRAGMAVQVLPLARLSEAELAASRQALFIASTTGEGDAPDSAAAFAQRMGAAACALPALQFAVLALGDSSYARYCSFGHALDGWLRQRQARPLFDVVEVDNGDAGALRHWQHQLGVLSGHTDDADWRTPSYGRWRLAQRVWLNPGSAGAPAFHLALTPLDLPPASWQAGDIAEIGPRNAPADVAAFMQALGMDDPASAEPLAEQLAAHLLPHDPAQIADLRALAPQALLARLPVLPHREYSIASLPADGSLDLLVRRMQQADGRPGLGSGWLTQHAGEGAEIALRIRRNSGFHGPEDDRPLILIGNGTGLAGLRAHLRARVAAGHGRNWLVFGERSRQHDYFHRSEIETWQAQGMLARLDLAFSRDQPQRLYVQDKLRQAADELRQWVAGGAAIYVCGSLQGMAAGVADALRDILGEQTLLDMAASGRYRRDVY